jgi:hypothetical protein
VFILVSVSNDTDFKSIGIKLKTLVSPITICQWRKCGEANGNGVRFQNLESTVPEIRFEAFWG